MEVVALIRCDEMPVFRAMNQH